MTCRYFGLCVLRNVCEREHVGGRAAQCISVIMFHISVSLLNKSIIYDPNSNNNNNNIFTPLNIYRHLYFTQSVGFHERSRVRFSPGTWGFEYYNINIRM